MLYQPLRGKIMMQIGPKGKRPTSALIHAFYASSMTGQEIEERSFEIIDQEAPAHRFTAEEWEVVRRMIHTTGDFTLMEAVRFSPDAIPSAIEALLGGRPIYVDSNMIRSGLSLARLQSVNKDYRRESILCYVADKGVCQQARKESMPRSLFALRKAASMLEGGIAVFGNSPIALLELNRFIMEEGIRPSLVIAMPVGFVHVVGSKEELMSLGVPCITVVGRRGGSPLAVSAIHALCSLASKPTAAVERMESMNEAGQEAVILLGHGSRVPGAGEDMEEVADRLKGKYGHRIVEIGYLSRLGPHLPEAVERCVNQGARKVIVIPYFLHVGLHLILDIPEMLQEECRKFPGVKLVLGKSLGFSESLVDLVQRRIEEATEFCDVKDLTLPSKERFPVPPGQCEFVPLSPDKAKKYRGKS
jgi:precorrin-8X/cobalt-precorrin-8 methylmutase